MTPFKGEFSSLNCQLKLPTDFILFLRLLLNYNMKKNCFSLLFTLLIALTACNSPFPPNPEIPHLTASFEKEIKVSIVDHREFILNGNKEPWFEGIFHGTFGIPASMRRYEAYKEQSLAAYLTSLTKEALKEAGGSVTVLEIPMGTDAYISMNILSQDKRPALLGIMRKSRYYFGRSPEYEYEFQFIVVGKNGEIMADKTFAKVETDFDPDEIYNIINAPFHIQQHNISWVMTDIYAQMLNTVLNDPEIGTALQELKN